MASSEPNNSGTSDDTSNSHANSEASNEGIHGHDELFDPPVSEDYKCPICIMVLRNPVQTLCGHRFCADCINNTRQMPSNGLTCPIDNQELNPGEIYPDNLAKREINQLSVKCRTLNTQSQCPWSGPLQDLEEHLKTCGFVEVPCPKGCNQNVERNVLEHHLKKECSKRTVTCEYYMTEGQHKKYKEHLKTCEFVEVQCPKGCNQNVERKVLEHHLKKECSKRTVTCEYCKTGLQHKKYKDHLGKCQKVAVACPNCNKKMLREKLTAGHDKECPKAQAVCEFKPYGCKWTGLRIHLGNHLTSKAGMAAHLSLLCNALTVLLRGNGRNKGDASKTESSGGASGSSSGIGAVGGNVLDELNRVQNRNAEMIATLEAKIEQMERRCRDLADRIERQQRENEATLTALKTRVIELEARMCEGVYLWRITEYSRHLQNARDNVVTSLYSPPFYTDVYGYKLCLRINPNGVGSPALDPFEEGSHVSLFVHVMQSDWDDTLEWPLSGSITLSILDQSDDGNKRHISKTLVTRPNPELFERPTAPLNRKGFGYLQFVDIATLESRQYIKDDCLLILAQVIY